MVSKWCEMDFVHPQQVELETELLPLLSCSVSLGKEGGTPFFGEDDF